jgi:hypothetical protein
MTLRCPFLTGALLVAATFAPARVFACAACFGQSDSAMAAGMNWGIISLLGMIVVVLGSVATFFIFLARRAAAVGTLEPTTLDAQPGESWSIGSEHPNAFDAEILASRGGLKHSSTLAQPPHRCAPVQTPGRKIVPRKRA